MERKIVIHLTLCVFLIGLTASLVFGQDDMWYLQSNKDDLFRAGRSLSLGGVFTNDLSVDLSKVNVDELESKAVKDVGKKIIELELGLSKLPYLRRSGMVISTIDAGRAIWNAWRVGTGRAEPDVLRSMIPHVVQAWDVMKGPQNLPTQTFTTQFNRRYDDGSRTIQTQGVHTFRQDFSTTAPGKIGHYGFDPFTDKIIRQTTTHTIQRETFDGGRFNKIYQDQPLTTPKMPTYTPPPMPKYTPPPIYTPPPMPRYTPPPSFRR